MGSLGDDSPDWVHSFKAKNRFVWTLSSESESLLDDDQSEDDDDEVSLSQLFKKNGKAGSDKNDDEQMTGRKRMTQDLDMEKQGKNAGKAKTSKESKPPKLNHSVWALSSDSESYSDYSLEIEHSQEELAEYDTVQHVEEEENEVSNVKKNEKPPHDMASTLKSPKKQLKKDNQSKNEKGENRVVTKEKDDGMTIRAQDTTEKQGRRVSSSRLLLVLPDKVHHIKALVECEGDSIDLSGDAGAVGRLMFSDSPFGDHNMYLDLKGTIYKTTIVPSRTFCVVSFGQSDAKIEAIMNDFIQLNPQSNVYEAETTIEGTLEGFSFDSEEEPDHPRTVTGQNGKDEPGDKQHKPKGKTKRKAEKATGAAGKKAKAAGGKPPKKSKKTQAPRKSKTKK